MQRNKRKGEIAYCTWLSVIQLRTEKATTLRSIRPLDLTDSSESDGLRPLSLLVSWEFITLKLETVPERFYRNISGGIQWSEYLPENLLTVQHLELCMT